MADATLPDPARMAVSAVRATRALSAAPAFRATAALLAAAPAALLAGLISFTAPLAQTSVSQTRQEAYASQYWDRSNQLVTTVVGKQWLSLGPDWGLGIKALGEWIRVAAVSEASDPHAGHHPGDHGAHDPGGASMDIDAVSGASVSAHNHGGSGEARGEATLSLRRAWRGAEPASLSASVRYSGEPDFHSGMLTVGGSREFFQRNTAVSGYLGGGLDYSAPEAPPPGEASAWPAASLRFASGVQLGQILTPRAQAGLSYALSVLAGTLENPYRRARILTSLFPERVPDTRFRHTAGAEIGYYLGLGTALFHRQGGYLDSWGVRAWIPETALPVELGERWLITPRHRYYYQLPADFYRTSYPSRGTWYSGDIRLGHLEGNEFGLDIEYGLGGSALALSGSFSELAYLSGDRRERSYVVALMWRSPG